MEGNNIEKEVIYGRGNASDTVKLMVVKMDMKEVL